MRCLKSAWLVVLPVLAVPAWAQTLPVPPPKNPQHYFEGHMDGDNFVVDRTSSNDHNYDPLTRKLFLRNIDLPNPRKYIWINFVIFRGPNSTFDPGNADNPWVNADAGAGFDVFHTKRAFEIGGSSLQFVEMWKRIIIEPNPPFETLDFSPTLFGNGDVRLTRLHVQTECVPEPASLTAGLVGLVGLAARRRRKV